MKRVKKILFVLLACLYASIVVIAMATCKEDSQQGNSSVEYPYYSVGGNYSESSEKQSATQEEVYSKGLRYKLSDDRTYYIVSGIGSCKDTDLVIPSTYKELPVKEIYGDTLDGAFCECTQLKSVVIPDSITKIGDRAFKDCSELINVTIGDSLEYIGIYAFGYCNNLISIEIPATVTYIGANAFFACGITDVYYQGDLEAWCKISGEWLNNSYILSGANLYIRDELMTTLVIPEGIGKIKAHCFAGCNSIVNVIIPESVTIIGEGAFQGCGNLINIIIPDSVATIEARAFQGCNLVNVTLGEAVTKIGDSAFYCEKLVEIYNKSSLKIDLGSRTNGYIGYYAKNIYTPTSGGSKLSTDEDGFIIYTDTDSKILVGYSGEETELIIPNHVTAIYKNAFCNNSLLTKVVMGDSLISIGESAFSGCNSLISVEMKEALKNIDSWAFSRCEVLKNIIIGDSVENIGRSVFQYCNNLESVIIGNSVKNIGQYAFDCGENLKSVQFKNTKGWWYADSSESESGVSIAAKYLANPVTAATYLRETYQEYYWKCTV